MRHTIHIAAALALGFAAGTSAAQEIARTDHLFPERSLIFLGSAYHGTLIELRRSVLPEAYGNDVLARMLEAPSGGSERMIGIRRDDSTNGVHRIFAVRPKTPLILLAIRQLPAINVEVERCDFEISAPLAQRILADWEKMLLGTRYGPNETGFERTGYHFHMYSRTARDYLEGYTWSPDPNTAPGMLVGIATKMADLCAGHDQQTITEIETLLTTLENRLLSSR